MKIQAIHRSTLANMIIAQLRDMILNGQVKPGERLPGHRDLAGMFGVSVTSVREAISALISAGMLETQAGYGTFVSQTPQLDAAFSTWLGVASNDENEMRELIEARSVLERTIARLAAMRATPEQIQQMHEVVFEMRGYLTSPEKYLEADLTFHMTMAAAAQNRVLLRAMYAIRTLLRRELQLNLEHGLARHGDVTYSVVSHEKLVEAIAAHDPIAAEAVIDEIMKRVAGYLDDEIETGNSSPA